MIQKKPTSKILRWLSYGLQGLVGLMFLMASYNNIVQTDMAVKGGLDMGYPIESTLYLGIVLLVSTVLYLVPQTAFFGAVLLTAWLGGAVATHVIHKDAIGMVLFPAVFGVVVWLGIGLRNERLKALLFDR